MLILEGTWSGRGARQLLRHAASKQRCEAIEDERSRRKEAEAAAKRQNEARQVLASPDAWDDLESLETLDGLRDEDLSTIKRAKVCVAAILKHLSSARKATTEEAFTDARRGLTEQLALLKGRQVRFIDGNVGRRARGLRRNLKARRRAEAARGRAGGKGAGAGRRRGRRRVAAPAAAVAPAPPAGGDARSKVVAIYEKCNPTKLGEVDNLLAKYAGREAELIARLQKKYAAQLGGFARRPPRPQRPPRRPRRRRPPPTPKPEPEPPKLKLSKPHRRSLHTCL